MLSLCSLGKQIIVELSVKVVVELQCSTGRLLSERSSTGSYNTATRDGIS
jgi:hypothetical protein